MFDRKQKEKQHRDHLVTRSAGTLAQGRAISLCRRSPLVTPAKHAPGMPEACGIKNSAIKKEVR